MRLTSVLEPCIVLESYHYYNNYYWHKPQEMLAFISAAIWLDVIVLPIFDTRLDQSIHFLLAPVGKIQDKCSLFKCALTVFLSSLFTFFGNIAKIFCLPSPLLQTFNIESLSTFHDLKLKTTTSETFLNHKFLCESQYSSIFIAQKHISGYGGLDLGL